MRHLSTASLQTMLKLLAIAMVGKIIVAVVLSYRDYMPPNFDSSFLQGREYYFYRGYHWAFYVHITSGPLSLLLGMILVSDRFRRRFGHLHRVFGRIQVICVLLLVAPSGLWMARHAESGVIAGTGFATLAVATGVFIALGWRAAVKRRFAEHRRWMWRCFLLLCSAVVLRIIGGTATVLGLESEWLYPIAAWMSWLLPLTTYDIGRRLNPSNV